MLTDELNKLQLLKKESVAWSKLFIQPVHAVRTHTFVGALYPPNLKDFSTVRYGLKNLFIHDFSFCYYSSSGYYYYYYVFFFRNKINDSELLHPDQSGQLHSCYFAIVKHVGSDSFRVLWSHQYIWLSSFCLSPNYVNWFRSSLTRRQASLRVSGFFSRIRHHEVWCSSRLYLKSPCCLMFSSMTFATLSVTPVVSC
jgi:hypothetical protein